MNSSKSSRRATSQRTANEYCYVCRYPLGAASCRVLAVTASGWRSYGGYDRIDPGVAAWNAYHSDARARQLHEYYRLANRKAMRVIQLAPGSFLYTLERARSRT